MRESEKPQTALDVLVACTVARVFEGVGGRGGPTNDDVAEAVRAAFDESFPDECLRKAHAGEPLFVMRAQDETAPSFVDDWAANVERHRASRGLCASEKPTGARSIARRMRAWAREHGAKLPD